MSFQTLASSYQKALLLLCYLLFRNAGYFFLNPCRFLWLPYGDFLPLYNSSTCCNFFSFLTVKPQPNKDKLLKELEKLKFLNGPSTVYNESRFVYLKQCGLYVEEYNVSKVRRGM